MDFLEIAKARQSCRGYQEDKTVEPEKREKILDAGRLAPSACNGQPYHITVCQGQTAKAVAAGVTGMGMNKFAAQAPVMLVISEADYCKSAAVGARLKKNDYRSIDIGILAAYLTAEAQTQGLSTCILGWLDREKLQKICGLKQAVRLVITLGYAKEDDPLRGKKRKELDTLVSRM